MIAQGQRFASLKLDDRIRPDLGHRRFEFFKAIQALIVIKFDHVLRMIESNDDIRAFAFGDDEAVFPGATDQHVVSGAAIQGLVAGTCADDDVVLRIAFAARMEPC
ncbi:hypothetical protein ASF57_07295 [Methylobacterium sp. Leaf117]|nr:hypothetical protein ASF57_07295 [Methylobacterium sp. Leaf117]